MVWGSFIDDEASSLLKPTDVRLVCSEPANNLVETTPGSCSKFPEANPLSVRLENVTDTRPHPKLVTDAAVFAEAEEFSLGIDDVHPNAKLRTNTVRSIRRS